VDFAFILSNQFVMIYFFIFILLVAAIAVVTHKLNAKTPCDHNWEERDQAVKCSKCGKKIPDYINAANNAFNEPIHEAA
jgi:hypothetical protein